MRAEVMQIVRAQNVVFAKLPLDAEVHLLHHGILHAVVDNVDARRAGAGQDKARKRISQGRRQVEETGRTRDRRGTVAE